MQIKSYGMCDAKGKTLMRIDLAGEKIIAPPDAPLALVIELIKQVIPAFDYSSVDAIKKDIKRMKDFANGLETT